MGMYKYALDTVKPKSQTAQGTVPGVMSRLRQHVVNGLDRLKTSPEALKAEQAKHIIPANYSKSNVYSPSAQNRRLMFGLSAFKQADDPITNAGVFGAAVEGGGTASPEFLANLGFNPRYYNGRYYTPDAYNQAIKLGLINEADAESDATMAQQSALAKDILSANRKTLDLSKKITRNVIGLQNGVNEFADNVGWARVARLPGVARIFGFLDVPHDLLPGESFNQYRERMHGGRSDADRYARLGGDKNTFNKIKQGSGLAGLIIRTTGDIGLRFLPVGAATGIMGRIGTGAFSGYKSGAIIDDIYDLWHKGYGFATNDDAYYEQGNDLNGAAASGAMLGGVFGALGSLGAVGANSTGLAHAVTAPLRGMGHVMEWLSSGGTTPIGTAGKTVAQDVVIGTGTNTAQKAVDAMTDGKDNAGFLGWRDWMPMRLRDIGFISGKMAEGTIARNQSGAEIIKQRDRQLAIQRLDALAQKNPQQTLDSINNSLEALTGFALTPPENWDSMSAQDRTTWLRETAIPQQARMHADSQIANNMLRTHPELANDMAGMAPLAWMFDGLNRDPKTFLPLVGDELVRVASEMGPQFVDQELLAKMPVSVQTEVFEQSVKALSAGNIFSDFVPTVLNKTTGGTEYLDWALEESTQLQDIAATTMAGSLFAPSDGTPTEMTKETQAVANNMIDKHPDKVETAINTQLREAVQAGPEQLAEALDNIQSNVTGTSDQGGATELSVDGLKNNKNVQRIVASAANTVVDEINAQQQQNPGYMLGLIRTFYKNKAQAGASSGMLTQEQVSSLFSEDNIASMMEHIETLPPEEQLKTINMFIDLQNGGQSEMFKLMPASQREAITSLIEKSSKGMLTSLWKSNPLKYTPIMAGLWLKQNGGSWADFGDTLQDNPALFWGGAALLLALPILAFGMMGSGDDDDDDDDEDDDDVPSRQQQQPVSYGSDGIHVTNAADLFR